MRIAGYDFNVLKTAGYVSKLKRLHVHEPTCVAVMMLGLLFASTCHALLVGSPLRSEGPRLRRVVLEGANPTLSSAALGLARQREKKVLVPRARLTLPVLTTTEEVELSREGSVERQQRRGRVGEAMIAVDTARSADEVWTTLCDVASWSELMRGVRSSTVREKRRGAIRAGFRVTKLRLPANVVFELPQTLDDDRTATIPFYLDTSCTNIAVDSLEGFWHVEPSPSGDAKTRVWLCANIGACAVVPDAAVDYVARKGLRRATEWLL